MTISISAWLSSGSAAINADTIQQRAALAWRRINDKKTDVAFKKPDGTTLSAQSVRIEPDSSAGMATSEAGAAQVRKATVFGVRGHALSGSSVPDTNMDDGFRFTLNGDEWRCVGILLTHGEIQGYFESSG